MHARILLVEDEGNMARTLAKNLERAGYEVTHAAHGELALRKLAESGYDVVLTDLKMPVLDGMGLMHAMHERGMSAAVVVLTGFGTIESAVEAMKLGAADYLIKDARPQEILLTIDRVLKVAKLQSENQRLRQEVGQLRGFGELIGQSASMQPIYRVIDAVSENKSTVLVSGESGTGKELVARTIHTSSPRHDAPFVVVNCAAIPEALLEDELFGHVRGAFTDATRDREGLLAAAHTGTLFLDEIGELPLPLQGKLLRVLQSQEFRRIGDDQDRRVDVRIVTATNRDLDQLVARGSFRQDLYYRINVFPMHLPPLRDRPEDIALLVHHFISKYRGRLGKAIDGITPGALRRFATYDFPGNVRELENKIHQAMVVAEGPMIDEPDVALPAGRIAGGRPDITRPFRELKQEAIDAFEKAYLTELLREHRGNLARAARAAGMDRKNLWMLVARHGLYRDQFRKP